MRKRDRFRFNSNVLFRGLEDHRELLTEPRRLRERYLELMKAHCEGVRDLVEKSAYDYILLGSDDPIAPVLSTALAARARRKAVVRRGGSA